MKYGCQESECISRCFQKPSERMPLPKTATIAARATEVYCEVWSVILQRFCNMPPTRSSDLNELSQLLPYLRQLLTCCACAGLLDKAMVSLTCGHCYCYECQFREPLLKIHCRQCRERTGLVIERQLQLVVNCYKSMCHILGEELRKDPLAFSNSEKLEANSRDHLKDGVKTLCIKTEPQTEKEKESNGVVEIKENRGSLIANGLTTVDPVSEIVREVEKGTKVSRAIFIIKPPSKYMNTRAAPALKKDSAGHISTSSAPTPKPSALSCIKGESKDSTPELLTKLSDTTEADPEVKEEKKDTALGSLDLDLDTEKPAKSKKRTRRKSGESKKKHKPSVPKSIAVVPSCLSEDTVSGLSPDTEAKPKLTKNPMSALKLSNRQRHMNARKRKQALKILPESKSESSKEDNTREETLSGNTDKERSEREVFQAPAISELETSQEAKAVDNQMEVKDLSISVTCLDDRYLSVTADKVVLQPHEQLSYKLKQALKVTRPAPNSVHAVARDQWKSVTRRRILSPFCSRVVVTRRGEEIARNIALMITAAKMKRKMRQKAKLAASTEGIKNHLPMVSPLSHLPRPRPRLSKAQRHSLPTPPIPIPPVAENDIPIPEHISILSADGKDAINDADINWTEFSNFFESTEEESIPELSSLDCYPPPHLQQQQHQHQQLQKHRQPPLLPPPSLPPPPLPPSPCKQNMQPLSFREFEPPIRMMRPPHPRPCLPLPPHRPHLPLPRPSHLPHPLPHPPPHSILPFSPMMGPDLPPPPPEFFPPPMTPGRIRPDMGGFSSPMTPRGSFPGDPCMDGMFHQGSPGQHPRGGSFPFPNSGAPFSPVSRGGFPRPTPPTTPVVVQQKKKSNSGDSMSGMVAKMKIKSQPSTPTKDLLATPLTPTKKRRSPGYSEAGWRCRCGTNKIMFPDKVCAKGKCPCYAKGNACKNCLCRYCHNPFGPRDSSKTASPVTPEVTAGSIAEVVAKIVETEEISDH